MQVYSSDTNEFFVRIVFEFQSQVYFLIFTGYYSVPYLQEFCKSKYYRDFSCSVFTRKFIYFWDQTKITMFVLFSVFSTSQLKVSKLY